MKTKNVIIIVLCILSSLQYCEIWNLKKQTCEHSISPSADYLIDVISADGLAEIIEYNTAQNKFISRDYVMIDSIGEWILNDNL